MPVTAMAEANHFARGYISSGFRLLCGLLTRDTRSETRCGYRVMPVCDEPKGLLLYPLAAPDSQGRHQGSHTHLTHYHRLPSRFLWV